LKIDENMKEELRTYAYTDYGKIHRSKDGKKTLCGREIAECWLEFRGRPKNLWNEEPSWRCKICEKLEKVRLKCKG